MKAPRAVALLLALAGNALAQSAMPELTEQNFVQAAKQPFAWLINIEQPSNPQSRAAATMLKPALSQAMQYYHGARSEKGVRVAHLDVQSNPQLRQILCEAAAVCPPLVLYRRGTPVQVYRGSGSVEDVVRWVERANTAGAGGAGVSAGAGAGAGAAQQQAAAAAAYRAQVQQQAAAALQASVRSGATAGLSGAASSVPGASGAAGGRTSKDAQAETLARLMAEYKARQAQAAGGGAPAGGARAPPPSGKLGTPSPPPTYGAGAGQRAGAGGAMPTLRGTPGKPSKRNVDRDGDGRADITYEDADGDGVYESVYEDTDGDGRFETMHEDSDGDGKYDSVHKDLDGDGNADQIHEDTTGNGKANMIHEVCTAKHNITQHDMT
jgi:hypothetical protein